MPADDEPTPISIAACLVFDDDFEPEGGNRELRMHQVRGALDLLITENEIVFDGEPQAFSSRVELFEALDDLQCPPGQRVLLIADLIAGTAVQSGSIGARLLRAVAQHPQHGSSLRRVAHTGFMVETVVEELAPYIHASAAYLASGSPGLAPAILHALDETAWEECLAFPAAVPVTQINDRMASTISDLLGGMAPQTGDDRIVVGLCRGRQDVEINAELDRISGSHRRKVMDFVTAVREAHHLANPQRARELIVAKGNAVSRETLDDGLPPTECDAACEYRRTLLEQCTAAAPATGEDTESRVARERDGYEQYLSVTGLTAAEDDVLEAFLRRYEPRLENLQGGHAVARLEIIQSIKGTTFEPGDPEFTQLLERHGMTERDLSYAIWTLSDVREGR